MESFWPDTGPGQGKRPACSCPAAPQAAFLVLHLQGWAVPLPSLLVTPQANVCNWGPGKHRARGQRTAHLLASHSESSGNSQLDTNPTTSPPDQTDQIHPASQHDTALLEVFCKKTSEASREQLFICSVGLGSDPTGLKDSFPQLNPPAGYQKRTGCERADQSHPEQPRGAGYPGQKAITSPKQRAAAAELGTVIQTGTEAANKLI